MSSFNDSDTTTESRTSDTSESGSSAEHKVSKIEDMIQPIAARPVYQNWRLTNRAFIGSELEAGRSNSLRLNIKPESFILVLGELGQ